MKYLIIFFALFSFIILNGCEDDPLLAPQEDDECTGSYCNLSLPGSNHDNEMVDYNPETF